MAMGIDQSFAAAAVAQKGSDAPIRVALLASWVIAELAAAQRHQARDAEPECRLAIENQKQRASQPFILSTALIGWQCLHATQRIMPLGIPAPEPPIYIEVRSVMNQYIDDRLKCK
jgi:hypothetical protein